MNLKTKAAALLAGSALALSVATGAMAADTGSSVTLADGEAGCSVSAVSATADFGNYTYNGTDTFVADATDGTATVTGSVDVTGLFGTPVGDECKLQISGTNLTADSGASIIEVGNITYNNGTNATTPVTGIAADTGDGNGEFTVNLSLASFSSTGITTLDQHNGTLTFDATNAD